MIPQVQTGTDSSTPVPLSTDDCRLVEAAPGRIQINEGISLPAEPKPTQVRLHDVAVGRSGDKGGTANITIIVRDPVYYQHILEQVVPDVFFSLSSHFIVLGDTVTRLGVLGVSAVNFVLTSSLGGGGLPSLRLDQ